MNEFARGFWVIGYREILRLVHQRARLVSSLATPLLFFALFGAGFNRLVGAIVPGVDLVTFMYPGIVALTVVMPSVFTGMSVVWDREFGFLREVLVAPLSRTGIALGKVAGGSVVAAAEGLVLLALAPVVGVPLRLGQLLELVPLLLLLAASLSSLGILIGLRLRSQEVFQTVMALVVFPLVFLSGIFFPVDATPGWLAVVAKLNPVTYGVDAIRHVLLAGHLGPGPGSGSAVHGTVLTVSLFGHRMTPAEDALILAAVGAVLIFAAGRAFARAE